MKQFTLLLRVPLLICSLLMILFPFHSSLLAQTNKKITPGTFSRTPNQITAAASGTGLQQFYSSTGKYTVSVDGIGSNNTSMNIRVNKPNAQSTVEKAILISSVTFSTISDGCVTIAGSPVNWDGTATVSFFNNYWADVTSLVAAKINAFPAGISTLPITECSSGVTEGEALLVVFKNPSADEKTVIVMLGAMDPTGDDFSVTLAEAIDPKAPKALLDMGLGIGYSYQSNFSNQASEVSVNGKRISSSAGGEDDGESANGGLITVGGIGDANDNPTDPFAFPSNPRSDDELYSILPFITNKTTSLTINTINPSLDDNIFLAYFVTSGAAVVGEGILLSQTSDSGNVGDNHTVKARLVDDNGNPITGRSVKFTVTAGPNAGNTSSALTNASGEAFYTYAGTGGAGTDVLEACFKNSQNDNSCSNTLSFKWIDDTNVTHAPTFMYPPTPTDGGTINAHPGENVMFTVKASDSDAGDVVTLSSTSLPSGAITTPALPTDDNPVSTKFSWTPGDGDVGTYPIEFTATDNTGKTTTTTVIVQVTSVSCGDTSFRPFIFVYPVYTVLGQAKHTIYKCYGPQTVCLAAVPCGASGNPRSYKFKWDNGSTSPLRRVSPDVTTRYEVDITDANGCTAHASITIYVVDACCGKNNDKVTMCCLGRTVCVDASKVDSLIKNEGATLGACDDKKYVAPLTASRMAVAAVPSIKAPQSKVFTAYPNPAVLTIRFKWDVSVTGNTKIDIMDLQGRVIISQSVASSGQGINISKLSNGIYAARLMADGKQVGMTRFTVSK